MQLFSGSGSNAKLRCPYKGCEKQFDKPTVITDTTVIPRTTHYACPFCMSQLELITQKEKIIDVRPTEYPTVFDSPAKCAHFGGNLGGGTESKIMHDDCLICPKVLQCNLRRQ